jgi:urocanate hydratase
MRLAKEAAQSCTKHAQAIPAFHAVGIPIVDYDNNIRQVTFDAGIANAFAFPGFVPAYIRLPSRCATLTPVMQAQSLVRKHKVCRCRSWHDRKALPF